MGEGDVELEVRGECVVGGGFKDGGGERESKREFLADKRLRVWYSVLPLKLTGTRKIKPSARVCKHCHKS